MQLAAKQSKSSCMQRPPDPSWLCIMCQVWPALYQEKYKVKHKYFHAASVATTYYIFFILSINVGMTYNYFVQLYLMYLKNWQKFFLCLKQDHGFGRGQGSPSRVLSDPHSPVARSAAQKDPGDKEGVQQFLGVMQYHLLLSELWFESHANL